MKKLIMFIFLILLSVTLLSCKPGDDPLPSPNKTFEENVYFHEGLVGLYKDGKWGFVNQEDFVVIDFLYDNIGAFYNGSAIVVIDEEYDLINYEGESLLDKTYEDLYRYEEGVIVYKEDGMKGLMKDDGTIITEPIYSKINDFVDGIAPVKQDDLYGYINIEGDMQIPLQFENTKPFSNGLASVKKDNKYGFIDSSGNLIIEYQYDYTKDFDSFGNCVVGINNVNEYLINESGETIVEYQRIRGEGPLYMLSHDDLDTIIKADGQLFNDEVYDNLLLLFDYHVSIDIDNEPYTVVFNEDGTIRHQIKYDFENEFYHYTEDPRIFLVQDNQNILVYIDNEDPIIMEADFVWQTTIENKFIIYRSEKAGIVDSNQNIIFDFIYDSLRQDNHGNYLYSLNDLNGILDNEFNIIIEADYTKVRVDLNPVYSNWWY